MATKTQVTETAIESATVEQLPTCTCGCNAVLSNSKRRFKIGHDATHKSNLLKRSDSGDLSAADELIANGWYSQERLNERAAKLDAKVAARLAKAEAKANGVETVEAVSE